jgi:hypothetical protein
MPSPADIREIFARPRPANLSNPYDGQYNSLLWSLFREHAFISDMDWVVHAMKVLLIADNYSMDGWHPIFIFLILPASQYRNSDVCIEADKNMRRLLSDADVPDDIDVLHGICVSGTRIAFYSYDREQQIISPPLSRQITRPSRVHFDFNLMDDDGATRLLEVVEEIKDMCREVVGDLNVDDLDSDSE